MEASKTDGVNLIKNAAKPPAVPVAPVLEDEQVKSQLEILTDRLVAKREEMKSAKADHEQNLKRMSTLRIALAETESKVGNSRFERLGDEEHEIMSQIQKLEMLEKSRTSAKMAGKGVQN